MERARESWTDERLDDLSRRVDEGFRRVDGDLRALRSDMNARFDAHDIRFDAHDARFDAMQRTILQVGAGLFATMVVGFAGLIATNL